MTVLQFEVAALTHRGARRAANEDTLRVDDNLFEGDILIPLTYQLNPSHQHQLLVADGMGGHPNGAVASKIALKNVRFGGNASPEDCTLALRKVNDLIYDQMIVQPEATGMGTTIAGIILSEPNPIVFNVGDSRVYRQRNLILNRLTKDHVPETGVARRSHMVTKSLGGHRSRVPVDPHVERVPSNIKGDVILVCTDGLTDMVSEEIISQTLTKSSGASSACQALFDFAMDAGGLDNISIILVYVR